MYLALCNNLAQLSWNRGDANAFTELDAMFADGGKKKKKKKKKHHTKNEHEETDHPPQQYENVNSNSIKIDNFIFPEYINMNFIVIGLSPHIMNQSMMKTFSMKIKIVTRKARKKRRNINMNIMKKKRNRNQVMKTRWRVRVSNTRRKVTRRKTSIRISNLCLCLMLVIRNSHRIMFTSIPFLMKLFNCRSDDECEDDKPEPIPLHEKSQPSPPPEIQQEK